MKTDWNLETVQEQLQRCVFVCEGGPLENNVAYQWLIKKFAALKAENAELKKAMSIHTAQRVNRELQAELSTLRESARLLIAGIEAYQYPKDAPAKPLQGIAGAANRLAELLTKPPEDSSEREIAAGGEK